MRTAIAMLVGLTLLAGWGDAQGFLHAAHAWNGGVVWKQVGWSLAGFLVGAIAYLLAQPFLVRTRILSPELQTGAWFAATIVLVASISGRFLSWRPTEQAVAVLVAIGIVWLLLATGSSS